MYPWMCNMNRSYDVQTGEVHQGAQRVTSNCPSLGNSAKREREGHQLGDNLYRTTRSIYGGIAVFACSERHASADRRAVVRLRLD